MLSLGEKPPLLFPSPSQSSSAMEITPKQGVTDRAMLWEMWLRAPFPPPCKHWAIHEVPSVAFAELGDFPRVRASPRWEQPWGQWGCVRKQSQRLLCPPTPAHGLNPCPGWRGGMQGDVNRLNALA